MAEVIGLIASIIGIIDGVDRTRTFLKKVIHTSKSMRAELLPILGKVSAFASLLHGLQLQCELDDADGDRLQTLTYIEEPLRACHRAMVAISARLNKVVSIGSLSLTFGKVLNKETQAALHILDQARPVLDLALFSDQRTLLKSVEAYVRNIAEDLRDAREENQIQHNELIGQLHEANQKELESAKSKARADILQWISKVDHKTNFQAALKLSQQPSDEAGDWFIRGPDFRDWIQVGEKGSRRLLLTGISGSGKTVLCAKAIDYLRQLSTTDGGDRVILYYFFDFNDAAKTTAEGMIRSLLSQLLSKEETIPSDVGALYNIHGTPISSTSGLAVDAWANLLSSRLATVKFAHIFIDAVDECSESELRGAQKLLRNIFGETHDRVKWLFTSRSVAWAEEAIMADKTIELNPAQVDRDIAAYLPAAFENDLRLSSFSKEARDCIIPEIAAKSAGMFRYAQCQLDSLAKMRDRRLKKVKEALRSMPQDIFSSYQRILTEAQSFDDWQLIERIIILIRFSARPVSLAEAAEYAALEENMTEITPDDRVNLTEIGLTAINMLVAVRGGILTLAHKSVQDFLESFVAAGEFYSLYQNADSYIATKCLQYLSFPQPPANEIEDAKKIRVSPNVALLGQIKSAYPFLDYAASKWPQHVRTRDLQEEVREIMQKALPLTAQPNLWKAWLMLQRADIWQTQVELAITMCEAFIRGSSVLDWSNNFWQLRQAYRIRRAADTKQEEKAPTNGPSSLNAKENSKSECNIWVKAVLEQDHSLGEKYLRFDKDTKVLITENPTVGDWKGKITLPDGKVLTGLVQRQNVMTPDLFGAIMGRDFLNLAVLLLEVALQTAIFHDVNERAASVCSRHELSYVLQHVSGLVKDARKMGYQFVKVVEECLSKVRWVGSSDRSAAPPMPLLLAQEDAMLKLHNPLCTILASGFHASRRPQHVPDKGHRNATQTTTISSSSAAQYRGFSSTPSTTLFSSNHAQAKTAYSQGMYRTAQPYDYQSGSMIDTTSEVKGSLHTYTTKFSSTQSSVFQANAFSAHRFGNDVLSDAFKPTEKHLVEYENEEREKADNQSALRLPKDVAAKLLDEHQEEKGENAQWLLAQSESSTDDVSGPLRFPDPVLDGKERHQRAGDIQAQNLTIHQGPNVFLAQSLPASQTNRMGSIQPEIFTTRRVKDHETQPGALETMMEAKSAVGSENSLSETSTGNIFPAPPSLTAERDDFVAHLLSSRIVEEDSLTWSFPDELEFKPWTSDRQRPSNVRPSDHEYGKLLERARKETLVCNDPATQMLWARDVLEHAKVNECNRQRAEIALHQSSQQTDTERILCEDAQNILTYFAEQGHPEAIFLKAQCHDNGWFGYPVDDERAVQTYERAAQMGFSPALHRLGKRQHSQNPMIAHHHYSKGVDAGDAGCLYEIALATLKGELGVSKHVNNGLSLLFRAAQAADQYSPEPLFVLGMMFAKKAREIHLEDVEKISVDLDRARGYLEKAAFMGHGKSQFTLGCWYEDGDVGFKTDPAMCLHYYILAARRGEALAEFAIMRIMRIMLATSDRYGTKAEQIAYSYARRAEQDKLLEA